MGKESCLQFAKHNPDHIWLAARTASKAESAIADIKQAVPNAKITYLSLDLTSMSSVVEAAEKFKSKSDRLDILLNNAGIMAVPVGTTKEGYEIQLGTNHIGHALLTKSLMPVLEKTASEPNADVRIINLTSVGHQIVPKVGINFDDTKLGSSSTWVRYGQSKLANILFTTELAKRYPSITSVAVHPGVVNTDLMKPYNNSIPIFKFLNAHLGSLLMNDVPTGTLNQLWAATAPKSEIFPGAYYVPVGKKDPGSKLARDPNLAAKLWNWTETELAKHGH